MLALDPEVAVSRTTEPAGAAEHAFLVAVAALAQPSRLRVYRLLIGEGHEGLAPSAIARRLDASSHVVALHLSVLQQAQLIRRVRARRQRVYVADASHLRRLMERALVTEDAGRRPTGASNVIDLFRS